MADRDWDIKREPILWHWRSTNAGIGDKGNFGSFTNMDELAKICFAKDDSQLTHRHRCGRWWWITATTLQTLLARRVSGTISASRSVVGTICKPNLLCLLQPSQLLHQWSAITSCFLSFKLGLRHSLRLPCPALRSLYMVACQLASCYIPHIKSPSLSVDGFDVGFSKPLSPHPQSKPQDQTVL